LLRRRYHHLHLGDDVAPLTPPIDPDVAAALYARYSGNLRAFLMLTSRAVQRRAITAPGVPLTEGDVLEVMAPRYREVLTAQLGAVDAEHLRTLVGGQAPETEFRVADMARSAGMAQASASKLMDRLERAGVIVPTRTERRSRFYRVQEGDATIALAMRRPPNAPA
jgi:DNA-binding MarR family transcriptional regulator